ncbi:MAG: hypothetical protein NUV63_02560 [Gallionella sp.]|nr:hypothetical protein [Gallionella sp.]
MNAERIIRIVAGNIILVTLPLAAEASLTNGAPANFGIRTTAC